MDYRHLGQSGLKISEIAYGNWITHGSQVEEAAGVRLDADLMSRIDEVLGDVVERDPARTQSPRVRP